MPMEQGVASCLAEKEKNVLKIGLMVQEKRYAVKKTIFVRIHTMDMSMPNVVVVDAIMIGEGVQITFVVENVVMKMSIVFGERSAVKKKNIAIQTTMGKNAVLREKNVMMGQDVVHQRVCVVAMMEMIMIFSAALMEQPAVEVIDVVKTDVMKMEQVAKVNVLLVRKKHIRDLQNLKQMKMYILL